MANKTQGPTDQTPKDPFGPLADLQKAGLGNMMGLGTAWIEAISDFNAEVAGFVAERIKEDVKTQHEILHCKDVAELQEIQSKFIQRAMDQYHAETGKLVEMSTTAFAPKKDQT